MSQTISTGKTFLPKTFTSQLNKNCQDDHLTAAFTALTEAVQIEARVKQQNNSFVEPTTLT